MNNKIKSNWIDRAKHFVYEFDEDGNELFVHVYKKVGGTKTHLFCGGNVELGKKGFSLKTYGLQRKPTKIYIYWQDLIEV